MTRYTRVQQPRSYRPKNTNTNSPRQRSAENNTSKKPPRGQGQVYQIKDYQQSRPTPARTRQVKRRYQPDKYNPKSQPRSKPWSKKQRLLAGMPSGRPKIIVILSFLVIVFAVSFYMVLPVRNVNNINVNGNQVVPSEWIINSSGILDYYPVKEVEKYSPDIEKRIKKQIPLIKSVSFERNSWKALEMNVTEHEVVAKIPYGDRFKLLLSNGTVIYTDSQEIMNHYSSDDLITLLNFTDNKQVEDLAEALKNIDPEIVSSIESIRFEPTNQTRNRIVLEMDDGNEVTAIILTLPEKMMHYPEILESLAGQKGIINFEVGAYFTPYSNTENSVNLSN